MHNAKYAFKSTPHLTFNRLSVPTNSDEEPLLRSWCFRAHHRNSSRCSEHSLGISIQSHHFGRLRRAETQSVSTSRSLRKATCTTIVVFSAGSVTHMLNGGGRRVRRNWFVLWQKLAAMREALLPANRVKAGKTEPSIDARSVDCKQKMCLGWVSWIQDTRCTI